MTASKPFQDQPKMIREGIGATALHGTEGPLLGSALATLLGLPYNLVEVAGASVTLGAAHLSAIVELLAVSSAATLPAQATFAWPTKGIMTIRSEYAFTLVSAAAVVVNGQTAKTWNCDPWPNAITLHKRASNVWGLTGAATVVP